MVVSIVVVLGQAFDALSQHTLVAPRRTTDRHLIRLELQCRTASESQFRDGPDMREDANEVLQI